VSETPVDVRHLRGPSDEHTAVSDPTVKPPQLQELRGVPGPPPHTQQQPIVVVSQRRSVIWPLLAFAMVVVSAGALYLVWNRPAAVVINGAEAASGSNTIIVGQRRAAPDERARADQAPVEPAPAPGADRSDHAVAPGMPTPAAPAPAAKSVDSSNGPFDAVVYKQGPAVNLCVKEHGQPPPDTKVTLIIAPNGRARSIDLDPKEADASPLGACIKGVFRATTFPRGTEDHPLTVKLTKQGRATRSSRTRTHL
jgi:hypothetical protein